jgi:regulatory protein
MALTKVRPSPPQLNDSSLKELALTYVGKYATSRAKLRAYLLRKLRERGWGSDQPPSIDPLIERFAELGYVDDASYALGASRSLSARGYGKRRIAEKLALDGIEEDDQGAANQHADEQSLAAALRFAERRRFGPFARSAPDARQREKWIASLVRAGHGFGLARAICSMEPGEEIDMDALEQHLYRL